MSHLHLMYPRNLLSKFICKMNETNLYSLMNIEDNVLLYNGSKNDKKMDHITQCKAITIYMLQTQKTRTQRLFILKNFQLYKY